MKALLFSQWPNAVAKITGGFVLIAGMVVLTGWCLDVLALKSIFLVRIARGESVDHLQLTASLKEIGNLKSALDEHAIVRAISKYSRKELRS